MALKIKTSTEGAGSGTTWLKEPGKYHAMILHADENPLDKNKQLLDGFKIQFLVMAGEHKGKQADVLLFNPNASKSSDAIAFAMRKQTACLIALGLITEDQMGSEVVVDLLAATNPPRQFFIELDYEKDKEKNLKLDSNGNPRLVLAYANIYHIDDPACADPVVWPRDASMVAKIPAACRRDPASFPKHERKSGPAPKNVTFEDL